MSSDFQQPRKRRSMFDVGPDEMAVAVGASSSNSGDNHIIPDFKVSDKVIAEYQPKKRKSMFDIPPQSESQIAPASMTSAISDFLISLGATAPASNSSVSIMDPAFKVRLKNAMTRNLEYIRKLDSGEMSSKTVNINNLIKPASQKHIDQVKSNPGLLNIASYFLDNF